MVFKYFLLAAIHVICITAVCDKETVEWTGGPLVWAEAATKAAYQSSGRYISKNMIATRGQIHGDHAYLAIPRYKPGVAATLVQVSLKPNPCDAVLVPFPCLLSQDEKDCQALQSVVDLFIDIQDVLWVLDVGVVNTLSCPIRRGPPKVVAFSLKTGKLLKTIDLSGLVSQASRLQYVVVEYTPTGKPIVYVSDAATRSILVYDVLLNKGYRVVLPKAIHAGCCRRDVLYIALVRKGCGNNYIIFSYLCSKRVFSIRTDYLRTGSTAGKIVDLGPKANKYLVLGTDLGSAVFFRQEGQPEIYRWDSNTCFKPENFLVVYKSANCFLSTQVMPDVRRQRMRILESNFPDYIQDTVGCGAVQQINLLTGPC
ncbi:hypothetical protein ILUMI_11731 [Ignelater luminosus]|uniref:Uncharacterized protein n=1 Tax=Ignelater luminosus TaxID=2038154 RepID=A0A8K0D1L9_IGNLU|nr:hypothetical protein ILUMI_11731 [Ignelater luminosus]